MNKFTTYITEEYKLEEDLKDVILKKTDFPDKVEIKCNSDVLIIKFVPNFKNSMLTISNVLKDISKFAKDYPYIGKTRIDDEKFEIELKKKK